MNWHPIHWRRAAGRCVTPLGLMVMIIGLLIMPAAPRGQNMIPAPAPQAGQAGTSFSADNHSPLAETGNNDFPPPGPGMAPPGFGFRHGRGGPLGGGPPGGGGFGFGRPRPSIRRWEDADQRLQEYRQKYEEIEARRQKLLDQLVAAKQAYQPEKMDPAAVLAQKTMDKLLGTLHQTVEEERSNTEEAGEILGSMLLTRTFWEPLLRRDQSDNTLKPQAAGGMALRERRAIWLKGLEQLDKDGPEGFAREVLGDSFGSGVFQAMPERMKRPYPMLHRSEGGPVRRQLMENIRQNWLARIERMERRQEELARDLERQAKEIEQMRLIMDNVLNDPEGEGNPPPPGVPQPTAPRPEQPLPVPGKTMTH